MKVIDKAEKSIYIFNCSACSSKLEANCDDLTIIGNKICKYRCPVCKKVRYISWSAMKSKTLFTGDDK